MCVAAGVVGAQVERSAAQRAQQLADVALAVYEAGGRAIHLPLDMSHPLVVVLRSALGFDAKGDLQVWSAALLAGNAVHIPSSRLVPQQSK